MKRAILYIFSWMLLLSITATVGFAGEYDFKKMTPEVQQALQNRQARYSQLQFLKQSEILGENNRGYVTSLKNDPSSAALAAAENNDRGIIYRALVEQNALGPNGMVEVQKAFAEVQRDKATPGEMLQSPSGDWSKKS